MIQFQKFTLKDIVFLAIVAAVFTVVGMLTVPLVLSVHVFGIRSLVTAPFYALFSVIALLKVKKPGALLIAGTLNGLVLLMMSPVMFFMQVFGSALAELIALAIYKKYDGHRPAVLAASAYIPLTLPMSVAFGMLLGGTTVQELIDAPLMAVLVSAGTIVLSVAGALIGSRVGRELQKAGKLQ